MFLSSLVVACDLSSGDTGSHVTGHVSPAYSTPVQFTVQLYFVQYTCTILLYVPENNTENKNRNNTHTSSCLVNILLASTLRSKERVQ